MKPNASNANRGISRPPLVAALLLVATGGVVLWFSLTSGREPVHAGRTLSSWLDELGPEIEDLPPETRTAFQAMGTNAIPHLLRIMTKRPSGWRNTLEQILGRSSFLGIELSSDDHMKSLIAASAFELLGPESQSAFTALTNLFHQDRHLTVAGHALSSMGGRGIDFLIQQASAPEEHVRMASLLALGTARRASLKVLPTLLTGLKDPSSIVRSRAVLSVVLLGADSSLIVPALAEVLNDSDARVQHSAAYALGRFGTNAYPALVPLSRCTNTTDSRLNELAAKAIQRIIPHPPAATAQSGADKRLDP